MTVARTVADVLDDHVVFEVECIDRMYLGHLSSPSKSARCWCMTSSLRWPFAKSPTAPAGLERTGASGTEPIADLPPRRGRRDRQPQLPVHERDQPALVQQPGHVGVLFVGRAQEKTGLFRTEKRRNAECLAYP